MPFPPDSRVLALLSVFEDSSDAPPQRYAAATWGAGSRYVHRSRAGDLEVTLWTHSGTAWVSLRGLLGRRAARALGAVLAGTDASGVVLDVAELMLPTASGGTPLVRLCATLSYAGYSVTLVGREQDGLGDEADLDDGRPEPLAVGHP